MLEKAINADELKEAKARGKDKYLKYYDFDCAFVSKRYYDKITILADSQENAVKRLKEKLDDFSIVKYDEVAVSRELEILNVSKRDATYTYAYEITADNDAGLIATIHGVASEEEAINEFHRRFGNDIKIKQIVAIGWEMYDNEK